LECRLSDENCCWCHQQNIYAVNQKLTHFDDWVGDTVYSMGLKGKI
jgi:hypothetical protein